MDIEAVLYDVNGTLVQIRTEDHADAVFRAAGHFLTYQGIDLRRHRLRDLYLEAMKRQRAASPQRYPEFDAVQIWRDVVEAHATDFTEALPAGKRAMLPIVLAELTRGVARGRLRLYPHVRPVLTALREKLPLAVVTDAQSAWARGELHKVGLLGFFDEIVVSGDHGYRKPDPRLFEQALKALGVEPAHALYVGNDMYRDVYGAREAGMVTVLFESEQGARHHTDDRDQHVVPDFTITDHRELLTIVGL